MEAWEEGAVDRVGGNPKQTSPWLTGELIVLMWRMKATLETRRFLLFLSQQLQKERENLLNSIVSHQRAISCPSEIKSAVMAWLLQSPLPKRLCNQKTQDGTGSKVASSWPEILNGWHWQLWLCNQLLCKVQQVLETLQKQSANPTRKKNAFWNAKADETY